jgi:hypothetical protein
MTTPQVLALLSAIYIAPHLPAPLAAFIGVAFAVVGFFV